MSEPRRIYWDSSCFICFLNEKEAARSHICDDVLRHAEMGEFEIWISVWVMVEVIRPKRRGTLPLPPWAVAAIKAVPEAAMPLSELWERFQRQTPVQKLTTAQIDQIQLMFSWPFIKKVQVDERVAMKAVEFCRTYNLGSGDAVHAATAHLWKCETIHRWDKDFSKVSHIISSEEPQIISAQTSMAHMFGPSHTKFLGEGDFDGNTGKEVVAQPFDIPASGDKSSESEAKNKKKFPPQKGEDSEVI